MSFKKMVYSVKVKEDAIGTYKEYVNLKNKSVIITETGAEINTMIQDWAKFFVHVPGVRLIAGNDFKDTISITMNSIAERLHIFQSMVQLKDFGEESKIEFSLDKRFYFLSKKDIIKIKEVRYDIKEGVLVEIAIIDNTDSDNKIEYYLFNIPTQNFDNFLVSLA